MQTALEGVPGVESAEVSRETNKATVRADANRCSADDLLKAVDGAGGGDRYKAKTGP